MSTEVQPPPTGTGIYRKLHAVMSEANYIQKDKENKFHGYKYASEAAIKEAVHALLVKHRVIFNASAINRVTTEINRTEKDGKTKGSFRTDLDLAYRFFDIDDGSCLEGVMPGSGVDGEDKGTYKALTGALKYCLTTQFIIPTGDDPESEGSGEQKAESRKKPANRGRESTTIGAPIDPPPPKPNGDVEYISEPQRNRLYAIVSKAKWKDDEVKALLKDFGVMSSKHIPKAGTDYERICGVVENGDYATYIDSKTNPVPASAVQGQ